MSEKIDIVEPENNDPKKETNVNIDELLAKARKDEKDKLYPQIETLKTESAKQVTRINDLILEGAKKDKEIESLNKQLGDKDQEIEKIKSEGVDNVNKSTEELQKEIEKLTNQLKDKDQEIEKVKVSFELKEYRATLLKDIDESVHELVLGDTKEAIDASAVKAKETFDKIASKFADSKKEDDEKNKKPKKKSMQGVAPVNMGIVNEEVFGDFKLDDVQEMDVTSPEYKNLRGLLGFK